MRILGIDLSTNRNHTGVVLLTVSADGHAVASLPACDGSDRSLAELAHDVDVIGVDAPLGWPAKFIEAITAHHDFEQRWPAGHERRLLQYRTTDLALRARGHRPLSVSADKLGSTAMRCAHLQQLWADEVWEETARRDGSGPLVEVYPAATLDALGISSKGYKGSKNSASRRMILDRLAAVLNLDLNGVDDGCMTSDHVLDGLVSAVAAWDAKAGRSVVPQSDHEKSAAMTEGWIHVRPMPAPEEMRDGRSVVNS